MTLECVSTNRIYARPEMTDAPVYHIIECLELHIYTSPCMSDSDSQPLTFPWFCSYIISLLRREKWMEREFVRAGHVSMSPPNSSPQSFKMSKHGRCPVRGARRRMTYWLCSVLGRVNWTNILSHYREFLLSVVANIHAQE